LAACGVSNESPIPIEIADALNSENATASENSSSASASGVTPSFSLAWSEYPSWSIFAVAEADGLINGKPGEMGSLEEKWKVDVVLHESDYDTCITMYGSQNVDAACLTNMDALNPSLSRASSMILPTSTSHGADACIVVDTIQTIEDLKGKNVYGLEKSVSEYCFVRNLEINAQKEKDYSFSNMDPAAAAAAHAVAVEYFVHPRVEGDASGKCFSTEVCPLRNLNFFFFGREGDGRHRILSLKVP